MRILPITTRMLDNDGDDDPNQWDTTLLQRHIFMLQIHAIYMLDVDRSEEKLTHQCTSRQRKLLSHVWSVCGTHQHMSFE